MSGIISLKLKFQKSKLNKLVLKEPIDINILNKLINSSLLKTNFNNKYSGALYENEKKQLIEYRKLVKDGYAYIKYNQVENMNIGRVTPQRALGLFSIRREIRQTLSKNSLVDIDIENCHPQILYQICKQNKIKCKYLTEYVNNRDNNLEEVKTTYKVDRESAKKLFIQLMYFGSFDSWRKDINNESTDKPTKFIKKFQEELKTIGDIIVNENPDLVKLVKDRKAEKNITSFNLKGSVCSYFLQEHENRILEELYFYCVKKGYITKKIAVLCADGFMIPKDNYNKNMLSEFNILIKDTFNLDLTFTQKEMTQDYLNILDDSIITNPTFKPYVPITTDITIKQINMNHKYVNDSQYDGNQLTQQIYDAHSTIIIKSTTGTGKTTSIAELFRKDASKKIISIIPRISLANQHKDTFKKKGTLLLSYLNDNYEKDLNVYEDNVVVCINSLLKLQNLPDDIIQNSIIYIDEIASFIESLVDNETLNRNLKKINILLMKLIKKAHKVIVSDAIINDAVFELLKHRDDSTKVYIKNEYIKYKNVNAIRIKNENVFLTMIKQKIINNEPFLFPCDSCKAITEFYIECLNISPEQLKEKFILVTADTKIKINNASTELKDKFVFYSPSITYGVDFQTEEPQDVFNYIVGQSIQPSGFFQQTTRTRNIKNLYYYCDDLTTEAKFNDVDEVKTHYKNIINITDTNLVNLSVSINENDEEAVIENTFFNLFCYNEYVKDVYGTNKLKHFEELLKNNGFTVSELGDDKKMEKDEKERLKKLRVDYNDNLFDEFLNADVTERENIKFTNFKEHINVFNLQTKTNDELNIIKECISNKYYFNDVLNYNRLQKSDEYIINKIKNIDDNSYKCKTYKNVWKKTQLLKNILQINNIELFTFPTDIQVINFPSELFEQYKIIYNSPKAMLPTNKQQFIKFLVDTYKNLMPTVKLIKTESTQLNERGIRSRVYNYNFIKETITELNQIIEIYGFNKPDVSDFDDEII